MTAFEPAAIDFELFALFLEARRIHRHRTVMDIAREAEIAPDEVNRATRGRNPGERAFFALSDWMGEPPGVFVKAGRP